MEILWRGPDTGQIDGVPRVQGPAKGLTAEEEMQLEN